LGWSPGDGREFLPRAELVRLFSFEGVGKKGAVFDEKKLEWLNSQYVNAMPAAAILAAIRPELEAKGLWDAAGDAPRRGWLERVIELLKARSRKLSDLASACAVFLGEDFEYAPDAVAKHLKDPETGERMRRLRQALAALVEPFDEKGTEAALRSAAESMGV